MTHDTDGITSELLKDVTRGLRGMDGEIFKRKLSEINTRVVSRRQNELVDKFKMVAGDKISIKGQAMEYIPTGIFCMIYMNHLLK